MKYYGFFLSILLTDSLTMAIPSCQNNERAEVDSSSVFGSVAALDTTVADSPIGTPSVNPKHDPWLIAKGSSSTTHTSPYNCEGAVLGGSHAIKAVRIQTTDKLKCLFIQKTGLTLV